MMRDVETTTARRASAELRTARSKRRVTGAPAVPNTSLTLHTNALLMLPCYVARQLDILRSARIPCRATMKRSRWSYETRRETRVSKWLASRNWLEQTAAAILATHETRQRLISRTFLSGRSHSPRVEPSWLYTRRGKAQEIVRENRGANGTDNERDWKDGRTVTAVWSLARSIGSADDFSLSRNDTKTSGFTRETISRKSFARDDPFARKQSGKNWISRPLFLS